MIEIQLTKQQHEIIDWYMGSTAVDHWCRGEGAYDWSNKTTPKLENRTFKLPEDEDLIEDLKYRIGEQYLEMADMAAEVSTPKYHGIKKTSQNIIKKIEENRQ